MNHLNINARIVSAWLKMNGWKRSKDILGRLYFIDPLDGPACYPAIAIETQMSRETVKDQSRE